MNAKTFAIRFVGLILISLCGSFLYALTFLGMQLLNIIPDDFADRAYGTVLTHKTTYVWMGAILLSFISIFIRENWRYVLYLSPLFAPALFAFTFTLMQR